MLILAKPRQGAEGIDRNNTEGMQMQSFNEYQGSSESRADDVWASQHADVLDWLESKWNSGNEFAASLSRYYGRNLRLTENQVAAVRKAIPAKEAAQTNVAGAGFTRLLEAFNKAAETGLKFPSIRVGELKFSLAPSYGQNAGNVYVKRGDLYLGKINPQGNLSASRDCDNNDRVDIARVGADPLAQAIAHGKQTGKCSCCGRELTDPVSIERGIGPICAERFGW